MKNLSTLFGIIGALIIGVIASNHIKGFLQKHQNYESIYNGRLHAANKWVLASRTQNYSDIQKASSFIGTKAWIYYKWESQNEWGVDFGNTPWDWQLKQSNGVVSVLAPELSFFGPKIPVTQEKYVARVVNKAWGQDEDELKEEFKNKIYDLVQTDGQNMLKDKALREICRTGIQAQIMSLLNQSGDVSSIPKVHQVQVTFADELAAPLAPLLNS